MVKRILSALLLLALSWSVLAAQTTVVGPTIIKGPTLLAGTTVASAPTLIATCANFVFTTPVVCASNLGTANVNDIVHYYVSYATGSGPSVFTPALSGACAASGGNVTDAGPTNIVSTLGTAQAGHFVITTGGACNVSIAYTSSADGQVSAALIRGSSGLDVASVINNQSTPGTGANILNSGSAVTLNHNDLCIASMVDSNDAGGTVTAGTTLAWSIGSIKTTFPNANESFTQNGSTLIATFGYTSNSFTQTQVSCYKP